ncbi:MAG: type 4a pilus biogenesis protein PilO [Armatimonadetes bacterium]|nr:type 4a pilus biogenesis protein PilO [Armatimonadota bacterium]
MSHIPSVRIAVLVCAGVVLVGSGISYWAYNTSKDGKARYDQLAKEVPDEGDLKRQVSDSEDKINATKSQLQHLEQSVPSLAYVPTLLTEMERLGAEHHILMTGVRPVIGEREQKDNSEKKSGERQKKAGYQEMLIDINGRGNYSDVMAMVDAIKKFPKIVEIVTVSLTPKKDTSVTATDQQAHKAPVLDATVRIRAYLFPMPQAGSETQASQGATS